MKCRAELEREVNLIVHEIRVYQAKQRLKHGKRDKAVTYCDLQQVKLRWQLNILLNLNKSLQNKNQQIIHSHIIRCVSHCHRPPWSVIASVTSIHMFYAELSSRKGLAMLCWSEKSNREPQFYDLFNYHSNFISTVTLVCEASRLEKASRFHK